MIPFKLFAFQIDLARQIERPEVVLSAIEGMHEHGYTAVMLYLEDAFRYPSHPDIARPHAYSVELMTEIYRLCQHQGMEIIPCIPALGHCAYITRKKGYEHYDEGRGTGHNYGTVSPSFPETYDLMRELFDDWCKHIPGKYLHTGLDESPAMGQYLLRTQGPDALDAAKVFATHCNRLNELVTGQGRRMLMWGDMFYYYPEAIEQIDRDIIVCDWYYYAFDKTPRVEAFNFAPVDLAGHLSRRGNDVWGVPSITVAAPMPDIADRWQNLIDWVRYGRETGVSGLLNTDWENHAGFYHTNADWLFRAFGDNLRRDKPLPLPEALRDTLGKLAGAEAPPRLIDDLLALGRYHVNGHENRAMKKRPLVTLANTRRRDQCRANWQAVGNLLADLPEFERLAATQRGSLFCRGLRTSHRQLAYTWRLGAELPSVYEHLAAALESGGDTSAAQTLLADLLDEGHAVVAGYETHWNEVRYSDDHNRVLDWLRGVCETLSAWIAALDGPLDAHPLLATARLQLVLKCNHPALPVLRTTAMLPDGGEEVFVDWMIRFESPYAVPDASWTQNSTHVLESSKPPERILCEATNYGQVGIERIELVHRGQVLVYRLDRVVGKNATRDGGLVWLGPIGATPDDPTHRDDVDAAWFVLEE